MSGTVNSITLGRDTATLSCYLVHPLAMVPKYGSEQASCFDLSACWSEGQNIKYYNGFSDDLEGKYIKAEETITLPSQSRALIPTGLIFDIPEGFSIRIHPRSGKAIKEGLSLVNCTGVIDSDYILECFIPVVNLSQRDLNIKWGERIAQGELCQDGPKVSFETISQPPTSKSDRTGGFGSTGV